MKTFRFKLFASNILLLIIFLGLLFPFVTGSVQHIVLKSANERADELIYSLRESQNDRELLQSIKEEAHFVFFYVALIDENGKTLFDSHTKRTPYLAVIKEEKTPSDVLDALKGKIGIFEEMSPLLGQRLVYMSKSFEHLHKKYVLRLAMPSNFIIELKRNFNFGFILFSSLVLILFSTMTVFMLYHFMWPVRQIIHAIKPYQEGKISFIPEIRFRTYFKDEFSDLAKTVNSLSDRIKSQIDTLTAERNEKEAILESLAEGVIAVDSQMRISYANSMALSLLELDGTIIGNAFPKTSFSKCYDLAYRCQNEKKLQNDEIELQRDGKTIHLNAIATPLNPKGAILVLQDRSIHYKILDMRKQFIANASHELKTPITIIRGFAETLQDHPDLPKEQVKQITEKIVRNTSRMTNIIRNLLTLADIENLPRFKLQDCQFEKLLERCANSVSTIYPQVKITIESSEKDLSCQADPELLELAFTNLLDNAAKYSKNSPAIGVRVISNPYGAKISITDNGIGIPQADLEHIFNRFYTVNKAESKKLGGSGLGLSIVETIVQKHMGKITVDSTVGVGSTFHIELPTNLSERLPQ
jgi:two-component system, OmpR family, phosphate regulon sensor histidine kinase PhoR